MSKSYKDKNGFLLRNRFLESDLESANLTWQLLVEVGDDYLSRLGSFNEYAGMLARTIQQYHGVHSVRWRVKDVEHVLAKIIRKRKEGSEKYMDLSVENYWKIITDLVGVRALHLYKGDAQVIDRQIRDYQMLALNEEPVIYKRKGDEDSFYEGLDYKQRDHKDGYRSIHYILQAQPQKNVIFSEVQVRTIFEEGWSEVDHDLRYPDYNSDDVVKIFLILFNRLAGQADEMGSFVRFLAKVTSERNAQLAQAFLERDELLAKIDELVAEVDDKSLSEKKAKDAMDELKVKLSQARANDGVQFIGELSNIPNLKVPKSFHNNFNLGLSSYASDLLEKYESSQNDLFSSLDDNTRKTLIALGIIKR